MHDYFHVERRKLCLLVEAFKVLAEEHKVEIRFASPSERYKGRKFLDPLKVRPSKFFNSNINHTETLANTSSFHQDYIKMKLLTLTAMMLAGVTAIQGTPQSTLIP
jgi:hypothetical protein